jgi:hypothetical protein
VIAHSRTSLSTALRVTPPETVVRAWSDILMSARGDEEK